MGKRTQYTPPPDYSGVARASEESARVSAQVAREQLDWAREQYRLDRQVSDRVIDAALARAEVEDANAAQDRARYESIFQPLEEDLVSDARGYTDERNQARAEAAAGRASSEVSNQFALARAAAQDRLESFGVDPSQTRAQALDVSARMQEAAARAGAANTARDNTQRMEEATGRALRTEALNIGRGYPGQVAQTYNTALQSGNQAVNSGIATTSTGANAMGTPAQWQGLSTQAIGTWGNTLNMDFNNRLASSQDMQRQRQQSSGIGSALGMLAGAGMRAYTGGMFADGGAVPELHGEAHDGVAVDPALSPSRGQVIDDVPARLNAGEFVVPEDVVDWKGQEWFQKLIQNSRKAKGEAPAKPQMRALPAAPPAVRTALPVG